jgi:hypothetical protein
MISPPNLPWYRSQVIIGAAISIITKLLVVLGIIGELAPEDSEQLTSTVVLVIGGLADIWAMRARMTQKAAPPITLTSKGP